MVFVKKGKSKIQLAHLLLCLVLIGKVNLAYSVYWQKYLSPCSCITANRIDLTTKFILGDTHQTSILVYDFLNPVGGTGNPSTSSIMAKPGVAAYTHTTLVDYIPGSGDQALVHHDRKIEQVNFVSGAYVGEYAWTFGYTNQSRANFISGSSYFILGTAIGGYIIKFDQNTLGVVASSSDLTVNDVTVLRVGKNEAI